MDARRYLGGLGQIIPEQENGEDVTNSDINIISVLLRAAVDTISGINTPDILCRCTQIHRIFKYDKNLKY